MVQAVLRAQAASAGILPGGMGMKKYVISAVAALALVLTAAFAAGQAEQAQQKHMRGEHGMFGARMAQQLGLSDAQRQQIKSIMETEKPKMQPLMQQLKAERQEMDSLTTSGTFDEAAVRAAASKQAQTITDVAVERARVKSQIFAVLTPEQRTKAQEMEKNFAGHGFGHRRGAHWKGQAANQQPGAEQ